MNKHIDSISTNTSLAHAQQNNYIGRFAPSPSGPLHFGSLVCALASYLHARQNNGKWLVRIEDIDSPRIFPEMNSVILTSLKAHGLVWDGDVIYQSHRHDIYEAYLAKLIQAELLYGCTCSRKQIRVRSGSYDGHCRDLSHPLKGNAIRFVHKQNNTRYHDLFWGELCVNHAIGREDPVLKRADGIYAYHLAVVADDIEQNITHIVRGYDLYETSPLHISMFEAFNAHKPKYLHMPVIVQNPNEKLSKQHHSPAIDNSQALENLKLALFYLGFSFRQLPKIANIEALLFWAIENWSPDLMPKQTELLILTLNGVYSAPNEPKS